MLLSCVWVKGVCRLLLWLMPRDSLDDAKCMSNSLSNRSKFLVRWASHPTQLVFGMSYVIALDDIAVLGQGVH